MREEPSELNGGRAWQQQQAYAAWPGLYNTVTRCLSQSVCALRYVMNKKEMGEGDERERTGEVEITQQK
jgi:hypothetical protein